MKLQPPFSSPRFFPLAECSRRRGSRDTAGVRGGAESRTRITSCWPRIRGDQVEKRAKEFQVMNQLGSSDNFKGRFSFLSLGWVSGELIFVWSVIKFDVSFPSNTYLVFLDVWKLFSEDKISSARVSQSYLNFLRIVESRNINTRCLSWTTLRGAERVKPSKFGNRRRKGTCLVRVSCFPETLRDSLFYFPAKSAPGELE